MHRAGVVLWPRRPDQFQGEWVRRAFPDHSKFELEYWEVEGRRVGLLYGWSELFDEVPVKDIALYRMGFVGDAAIAVRVEVKEFREEQFDFADQLLRKQMEWNRMKATWERTG